MKLANFLIAGCSVFAQSCYQKVDAGRNTRKPVEKQQPTQGEQGREGQEDATDLGVSSSVETVPDSAQTSPQTSASGQVQNSGTCLGSAPLPETLTAFCQLELHEDYAKIRSVICEESIGGNAFYPQCGWDGKSRISSSHLKAISFTPKEDKESKLFNYVSAYLVNIDKSRSSAEDAARLKFRDYEGYKKQNSATVSSVRSIKYLSGDLQGGLDFEIVIAKSGFAMTFSGQVKLVELTDDSSVVLVRSDDTKPMVKAKKYAHALFLKEVDGKTRGAAFTENTVQDNGRHDLALEISRLIDQETMKEYLNNGN